MKKLIILLLAVLLLSGCGLSAPDTDTKVITKLHAGETIEEITSDIYMYDSRQLSYEEFRAEVLKDNSHLYQNGRLPQIGDTVMIKIKRYPCVPSLPRYQVESIGEL